VDLAEIIPQILRLLFLHNKGDDHHPRCAYVSTTIRNPATFQVFLQSIEKQKLTYEEIDTSLWRSHSTIQFKSDVVLFKISWKNAKS
jgi:hypothetical protein